MPRPGPRTTPCCSEAFNATAVALNQLRGVQVQDVAASLHIHPFMLSRWRKQVRQGEIVSKKVKLVPEVAAELKALRKLKKLHLRGPVPWSVVHWPRRCAPAARHPEPSFTATAARSS